MNITTLLIANRGEIALRIMHTAKRLGLRTVAVFAEADRHAPHVAAADVGYCLGSGPVADTYLAIDKILAAMRATEANALHPGYGFLSENTEFARQVLAAGFIWVGPPVAAMHAMASKARAKKTLAPKGVPMIPGYHGEDQTDERLLAEAKRIGLPLLVKAASGGGGKGMKVVTDDDELPHALAQARREAKSAFGDDQLLLEKYLDQPRHIEVQIMADQHGQVISLFERDCSVQRRHQKVLEEAPADWLAMPVRQAMWQAAETAAREIGYTGAGTVEFILAADQSFYFLEMNTRLQVEHPVTELITGLDLVEWQLRVAQGEALTALRPQTARGHAIEVRFYAEDPARQFLPQIGQIAQLCFPDGDGIRIDSGVSAPSAVSQFYDPMLAKIIVHGDDRASALQKLRTVLSASRCFGLTTNLTFLRQLLMQPEVASGTAHTRWLDEQAQFNQVEPLQSAPAWAALAAVLQRASEPAPWQRHAGWRISGQQQWLFALTEQEQVGVIKLGGQYRVVMTGHELFVEQLSYRRIDAHSGRLQAQVDQVLIAWDTYVTEQRVELDNGDRQVVVDWYRPALQSTQAATASGQCLAELPGTVTAVYKQPGDRVCVGDKVLALEAMKMEMTHTARVAGTLTAIAGVPGDQVAEGDLLFEVQVEAAGD